MPTLVLHIAEPDAWKAAQSRGSYAAASLETEGFIHCSLPDQIVEVADHFFAGRKDLVLLVVNADRIEADVRRELAPNGKEYPHVYGVIPVGAVTRVVPWSSGPDGTFELPSL